MKLTNLSTIPNKTVRAILKDLGISKTNVELAILIDPDLDVCGKCHLLDDGMIVVAMMIDGDIPTLAHELKHVEQFISGLGEWIEVEIALTEYDDQWHEIEASEYESKYKAA